MTRSRFVWAAAFLTVTLACLTRTEVRAADGPGSEALKKHGLRIAGSLAVAEEEAEIKNKLAEIRRLAKQLSYSRLQQKGTMSPQDLQKTVKTLNSQITQLKSELSAVNQQMAQMPRNNTRFGGRFGGSGFSNNYAAEMFAQLTVYRNQLQMEVNQDSLFLNQIKDQGADPKAKEKIDSQVRDRREAYHQAVLDLRELVDAAKAKYDEAAQSVEVKKALALAGRGLRERLKLGPSHDFLANVKLLEKLEKAEPSDETEEAPAKPTQRSRSKTKGKT